MVSNGVLVSQIGSDNHFVIATKQFDHSFVVTASHGNFAVDALVCWRLDCIKVVVLVPVAFFQTVSYCAIWAQTAAYAEALSTPVAEKVYSAFFGDGPGVAHELVL